MSPINLRKLAVSLAIFAIFTGASALTAQADPVTLINGGSSVEVVYTASGFPGSTANAIFSLNDNVLTVQLSNTSTDLGTALTALGFNTTPNVTVSSFVGTGVTSGWTLNGALGGGQFEVSRNGQGQGDAINAGGTETLTFNLLNFSGNLTIDLTAVHLQSLPDGTSQKPIGGMPEPTSMLLLGTGLIGIATQLRKRFRRQPSINRPIGNPQIDDLEQ